MRPAREETVIDVHFPFIGVSHSVGLHTGGQITFVFQRACKLIYTLRRQGGIVDHRSLTYLPKETVDPFRGVLTAEIIDSKLPFRAP